MRLAARDAAPPALEYGGLEPALEISRRPCVARTSDMDALPLPARTRASGADRSPRRGNPGEGDPASDRQRPVRGRLGGEAVRALPTRARAAEPQARGHERQAWAHTSTRDAAAPRLSPRRRWSPGGSPARCRDAPPACLDVRGHGTDDAGADAGRRASAASAFAKAAASRRDAVKHPIARPRLDADTARRLRGQQIVLAHLPNPEARLA